MAATRPSYLKGLLGDVEAEAMLDARAMIAAMLRVEAALAAAQAETGDVAPDAAAAIAAAVDRFEPDMDALCDATERDGVVVPDLVRQLRAALPAEARHAVHWGATSQDIADGAMALCLRNVIDLCEARLTGTIVHLAGFADRHRDTIMASRTRGQQAVASSFGLKAAGWMMPLVRWHARLGAIRADALLLSLGGAGGTAAAYGSNARGVEEDVAGRLGLGVAPLPIHAQRDGRVVLGGWFAGVTASLAKAAGDILLMCQSEVGELRLTGSGGSSSMPNKRNPTRAEAVVALAVRAEGLSGPMNHAMDHAHERGGVAWMVEWQALPDLAVTAAAALRHMLAILESLDVDNDAMRRNAEASNGLLLAEAVSFRLAEHMPRPEAAAMVKAACAEVAENGTHLIDLLKRTHAALPIDWDNLRDLTLHRGQADTMIDRALAAAAPITHKEKP